MMKKYTGVALGEINENLPEVNPEARSWISEGELEYLLRNMSADNTVDRHSAVALAALIVNCPVPGNVYESKGGDENPEAAKEVARTYLSVRYLWREMIVNLESNPSESNRRKLEFLQGKKARKQGDFVSPNWPPEEYASQFENIQGITMPASYAIPRILTSAISSKWDIDQKLEFHHELMKYIVETDCSHDSDFIDFIVGVTAKSVELTQAIDKDPTFVFKCVFSYGYYVAENNLRHYFEYLREKLLANKVIHPLFRSYLEELDRSN
jgi:hypothetical protein